MARQSHQKSPETTRNHLKSLETFSIKLFDILRLMMLPSLVNFDVTRYDITFTPYQSIKSLILCSSCCSRLPSGSPTSESPAWWAFLRWDILSPSVISKQQVHLLRFSFTIMSLLLHIKTTYIWFYQNQIFANSTSLLFHQLPSQLFFRSSCFSHHFTCTTHQTKPTFLQFVL